MKKIALFTFTLCFISMSVMNAQFEKSKILLGVSSSSDLSALMAEYFNVNSNLMVLGFSSFKFKSDSDEGDSEKFRSFNVSPRVGFFLVNNLAAGIDFRLSLGSFGTGNDKETQTLLALGPFVKYYIPGEKLSPFLEIGASFGTMRDKYVDWNEEEVTNKVSNNSFYAGIGLALPIAEKVKLDLMGGYFSSTAKSKEDNSDNSRLIFNTLGLKLGFIIILGSGE